MTDRTHEPDPAMEATQAAPALGHGKGPGASGDVLAPVVEPGTPCREPGELDVTVDRSVPVAVLTRFGITECGNETTAEDGERYAFADGDRDLAEIGRGGIGRVLLAFDRHLRREVAIKELKSAHLGEAQQVRFLREARVTGQLEHPGVVPVYELGHRSDGTLYYAMRLVRGRTLKDALRDCGTLEERLRHLPHFVQLCQTIAYAHSRGVIHRDIKPDNVMIGEFGETIVLDWGLARAREAGDDVTEPAAVVFEKVAAGSDASLTMAGDFLGTPSYVAPEQARGEFASFGGCADIWSLGAVLYELLTGRPPFVDDSLPGLLMQVFEGEVQPPNRLVQDIPAVLSSICMKALERDPAARYAGALELAGDIEAFRSGHRVQAHEYTAWEHLVRFAVQKKGLMVSIGAVLMMGIVALVLVSLALRSERQARREAQEASVRAVEARVRERGERLRAGLHFAQGAAEKASRLFTEKRFLSARVYAAAALNHNPVTAPDASGDASRFLGNPEEKAATELAMESLGWEWMARRRSRVEMDRMLVAGDAVNGVAVSPDGSRVAAVTKEGWLAVWDTASGQLAYRMRIHQDTVWAVAFSPDGGGLAVACRDGRLVLLDAPDGRERASVQAHPADAFAVVFHPDGDRVATGGGDGVVRIWRVKDLVKVDEKGGHDGAVHGVAFSPDGRSLATAGRDRSARVFGPDRPEGMVLKGHSAVVRHVAFSPDGDRVATASYDKTIRVHDVTTGDELLVLSGHGDEVLHVAFSPDGRYLASSSWDRTVRLWDASGFLVMIVDGHDQAVWGSSFSGDGTRLVTAGEDGTVRLWRMRQVEPEYHETGQGYLWSIAVRHDGKRVATAGADGMVRIWDADSGKLFVRLKGHVDVVSEVVFSPDGRMLASGGYDGTVRLWDLDAPGNPGFVILGNHEGFVRSVSFSPDGRMLASGGHDGMVRLWDVTGRSLAGELGQSGGPAVRRVAFSPDGRMLASACRDGRVRLWDVDERHVRREINVGTEMVVGLDFAPCGKLLAASDMAGRILLADPANGNPVLSWQKGSQGVYTLRWFPDGRHLMATGDDRSVSIWDRLAKGETRRVVFRMSQSVIAGAVFPDGRRIVMADSERAFALPLESGMFVADPKVTLQEAQRDAGVELAGFYMRVPFRD